MWIYEQDKGVLRRLGQVFTDCYSGAGDGKNDPAMQGVHNRGPIPQGIYMICPPENTETHGPYVLPLIPDPQNLMFGRAGFLIHGDSVQHPGQASEGCIIASRVARESVWASGDRTLNVIADASHEPPEQTE